MQYQVLVKHIAENGYIASVIGVPDCVVEGRTEEDAISQAESALKKHLAQGKIVTIEVENQPESENPLLKHAGRFKDDPYFDEVLEEIEKYRRELDAELENE